jgi:outer membrane protein
MPLLDPRPCAWPVLITLASLLGGCAADAIALAPSASDVPFRPASSASAGGQAIENAPPTRSRDFALPPATSPLPGSGTPEIDPRHTYTLAELIDLAQSINPDTKVAWEQARQAALAVGLVKALYLPELTATVVGGYQQISGGGQVSADGLGTLSSTHDTDAHGTISSVAMRWLLFDFGQRDALATAAGQVSLASNIRFNGTHQRVVYDVARQFYEYTAARQRTSIAQQSRGESARLFDAAQDKLKHGIGTTVDVAQAQQLLAQADLALVQAQGAERDNYHALLSAIGLPLQTAIKVEDVSHRPLSSASIVPVEQLVRDALARRPDIQASAALARAAKAGITAADADFLPKVFVTGSSTFLNGSLNVTSLPSLGALAPGGGSGGAVSTSTNSSNQTILGGIAIPLYDGGLRQVRLLEAQSRADAAEQSVVRLQQNAATEIVAADDALRTSFAANKAAGVLVQASTVSQSAASSAYGSGAGTLTAGVEAEKLLLSARLAQAEAHGTALIAAAALAFATGHLGSPEALAPLQASSRSQSR